MIREVAEELVRGWHRNEVVYRALQRGLLAAGVYTKADYVALHDAIGLEWICGTTCREVLGTHFSVASDALWDGRDDETAIALLMTTKASKARKSNPVFRSRIRQIQRRGEGRLVIHARERDHRSNWRMVK